MSRFSDRGAASELARLLDAAAGSLVPVPAGSPAGLALRLQAAAPALAATAVPRPEFRAALRTRLLAVATVQAHQASTVQASTAQARRTAPVRAAGLEAAVSWSRAARARRGVGVAVGAMASVVVVAGVATAGAQSLPGQPFYGVKSAGESFQLRTADGPAGKGRVHLDQAARRLDEVAQLTRGRGAVALDGPAEGTVVAGGASSRLVVETLADMDASTRAGRRLLLRASRGGVDPRPLAELTTFAARQDGRLSRLVDELPAGAQAAAQESLDLVEDVGDDALTLLLDRLPAAAAAVASAPSAVAPVLPGEALPLERAPLETTTTDVTVDEARGPDDAPGSSSDSSPEPAPSSDPEPAPSGGSPTPSPSPSSSPLVEVPLPAVPLPVPVPTSVVVPQLPGLPLPVPSSLPTSLPTLPAAPLPAAPSVPGVPALPTLPVVPALPGLRLVAVPAPAPAPPAVPSAG